MQTIRGRLTAWYASAVALTLAAFAGILYVERRSASYQELDQRIRTEADQTNGILSEIYGSGGQLIQRGKGGTPELISQVAATLEPVPGFLLITTSDSVGFLFASADVRAGGYSVLEQIRQLARTEYRQPRGPHGAPGAGWPHHPVRGPVGRRGAEIRYGARRRGCRADGARRAGAPDPHRARVPLQSAGGVAAGILDRAAGARALDQIITEVEEISDGRSLHRRLPQPMVKDEFGRLSETLNDMMGRLERSFVALRRFYGRCQS